MAVIGRLLKKLIRYLVDNVLIWRKLQKTKKKKLTKTRLVNIYWYILNTGNNTPETINAPESSSNDTAKNYGSVINLEITFL